jgi:hypothetical protein
MWEAVYGLVMEQGKTHEFKGKQFSDAWVVLVFLWSVLKDRPRCWACDKRNWPERYRWRPLPSPTTLGRRLRTVPVLTLLEQVMQRLRELFGWGPLKIADSKPLPVGGHSKDRDARYGRGAGTMDRGYRVHVVRDARSPAAVDCWTLAPMNRNDRSVAEDLLAGWAADLACGNAHPAAYPARDAEGGAARDAEGGAARDAEGGAARDAEGGAARDAEGGAARDAEGGAAGMFGYLVTDNNYDSNRVYDLAAAVNLQLVAPPQSDAKGLGHRPQSPHRLRGLELARRPHPLNPLCRPDLPRSFGQDLLHARGAIERTFGLWGNWGGGMGPLPNWVRRPRRVALWVAGKMIFNAAREALATDLLPAKKQRVAA